MPYGVIGESGVTSLDHTSPFATVSTPSDVAVYTPEGNSALSPGNERSRLSLALHKKKLVDRGHMFLEGRMGDLLKSLSKEEKRYVCPP